MAAMTLGRALLGGVVATLALAGVAPASPKPAARPQPIQGAWSFEGGTVLIQPVAKHRFVGVVVRKTTFGTCTHPGGQRMWTISGSGRSYIGTHLYFKKSLPCAVDRPGQATWIVNGGGRGQTLGFCSAEPGTGPPTPSNPTTLCHTLPRVAVPASLSRSCTRLTGALNLCVNGPTPLRTIGCLPRGRSAATFTASLTGSSASATKLPAGPFRLDRKRLAQRGRTIGGGRTVSFPVRAARFAPGPHMLRAIVGSGGARRTLKKTVWVCD
jgi:hypothetical protein